MQLPLSIIPKPEKITLHAGSFVLAPNSSISYVPAGRRAAELLKQVTGFGLVAEKGAIQIKLDPDIQGDEAYQLEINERGISISASTSAGLFYGAQTVRQLLPASAEKDGITQAVDMPCLHIEDRPRFQHRGFMLDVSRHFFNPTEIKRVLDLLALQKLNRFHWNLTNDQGWRIEIKKYPRLTEIGSKRKATQVDGWILSKPVYDGIPYEGFYTQEEVREIVAYAKENFIEVIPEINSPGHAAAAIAAYPELSCAGTPSEVRATFTSFSKPLCVGKDFAFEFLENVFTEIAELFPFGYIHIGGDEVNKKEWKKCPHCRRRVAEQGLKSGNDLQTYYENQLVKRLKTKGVNIIAWNEAMHADLDKAVINQYWFFIHRKKSLAELQKGRKTIVSDASALYLDYSYKVMELLRTYNFEPQFPEVTDEQAVNILGVESALWTEYVYSRNRMDWQMFPRLLAVSETAWTPKHERNYQDFLTRLESFEQRLNALDVHHATRECYLKYQKISKVPSIFKVIAREHPAMQEYKQYHPLESRD